MRAVLKSYRKNILREMKDNLSRMVSLFGIVALGVMMLTGLMSFAPSMRIAGQKYYVSTCWTKPAPAAIWPTRSFPSILGCRRSWMPSSRKKPRWRMRM